MRKYVWLCLLFCVLRGFAQDLEVRPNDPVIYKKDGSAFLWLGDTAWELFHVLNKDEIIQYLDNRKEKGFTVIQAVVLSELEGLDVDFVSGATRSSTAIANAVDAAVQYWNEHVAGGNTNEQA